MSWGRGEAPAPGHRGGSASESQGFEMLSTASELKPKSQWLRGKLPKSANANKYSHRFLLRATCCTSEHKKRARRTLETASLY